ncbi:MAG: hypothetical protein HC781_06370 [Leptolyngbyaceae cyanobacterium CSU_1_4]|nr:hypothetical protein [Leptolyngbyaceae cyanobacterium CSU_1_4]
MLAEIEDAITKRLETILQRRNVRLESFPDAPKDLGKPSSSGKVLVGYKKSSFRVTNRTPLTMEQLAEFELSIQVKNLRTHTGAYTLLDQIRFGLLGFIPLMGASQGMYPVSEGFTDLDEGSWYYSQTFLLPLTLIEGVTDLYAPLPIGGGDPFDVVEIRSGVWRLPVGRLPEIESAELDREIRLEANPTA